VLVADCVPVLLCARSGREVAAVHAGWRGLAAGILARAVANFAAPAGELLAWIGPAIGPAAYVVGPELRARFVSDDPGTAGAFTLAADGWHLDLKAIAALRLDQAGVREVRIDDTCVHTEASRFYSHRRTGTCGRMAALIWLDPE
jgi:polyphenol oxidase